MTIRLGFYGAGLIASLHTWSLRNCGVDHQITAVCDPDPDRAAVMANRFGAAAVGEDELLDLVDAVFVTTWTSEHLRLVEKVAARGLPVFCEKPLAIDAPTAQQMVDIVERAGVINQVGLILRTSNPFRYMRHLVNDARAGRVLTVVFRDDQFIPNQGHYASTWRMDKNLAGRGTLLEHSIHDVDILQWMLGPVASVSATTREKHGFDRIDDLAVAMLEFTSGAVASLTSVWHDILERPSLRRVEVFCDNLYVALEGDRVGPVRWQFTGEPEQVLEGDALVEALGAQADENTSLATNFLRAVRDGHPADPAFAEAMPAHRIVDAAYASADAGRAPVSLL